MERSQMEWDVERWFNTDSLQPKDCKGKVTVIYGFQMLCPGCVIHGIPMAKAIRETFSPEDVQVIGLHTVFEHHDAMKPHALEAFISEYRISFPVAVDRAQEGKSIPATMDRYQMRGTPSYLIFDVDGVLRFHEFGQISELLIGSVIGSLLTESRVESGCDETGCRVDASDDLTRKPRRT